MLSLTLFVLLACDGKEGDSDAAGGHDSSSTADSEPLGDDTAPPVDDTASGGDTDVADTAETNTDVVQATDLSASLNDTIESLITVSWQQNAAATAWVEYKLVDEDWRSSPPRSVEVGGVEQLLLGVPYEEEVTVRVVNDFGEGSLATDELSITTGALPATLPQATLISSEPADFDPETNFVFLSMSGGSDVWTFIVDRQGRVVWAWEVANQRISLHPRVSHDGTEFLIDYNSYWTIFDGGDASQVLRLQIDGTEVERLDTPGLHHPFTETADHSLVYAAALSGNNETLVQLEPDGTATTLFDCDAWRTTHGVSGSCGSNTLWWDEKNDRLLYSLYSVETVIEVDRVSGEALRWFGHAAGSWGFEPEESAFWWQHGGYMTEAGTFLTSSKVSDRGRETVIREYTLDEENENLVEIWSFGEGEGVYGSVMGEAHRLANGNTLHNYGDAARIREATEDGRVVWDIDWSSSFMGRSTPIDDLYAFTH